ncbi:MAG: hypothetical protein E6274_03245 [Clostridium sp.]|uniref:hypothetical protein n=1 Tax=Clostridium sp. TaxID=1506 RepID=UPI0029085E0A|nr:hypothetical protein [Clostridium sp.]MDU7251346.1 hypothetical protein [Clostridium sp.]
MRELYRKFKNLTGFNYQYMADKVGVSKQHIHASMSNYSMLYKTSMAAIMSCCIDDKINDLERNIEELKIFKKEVIKQAVENSSDAKGK